MTDRSRDATSDPRQGPPGDAGGRASRARVVVVGDELLANMLLDHLRTPPVVVRNVFEAIGEITAATAGRPIAAVLIAGDAPFAPEGRAAEALKRTDPSVQVVRIVARGRVAETPADWDDVVESPVDMQVLAGVLGEHLLRPSDTPRPPAATAIEPATPAGREDAPERLGDTDLVDAVLDTPDAVLETALALIRQHTGWDEVALVEPEAGSDGVTVEADGVRYGLLSSPQAGAAELGPWAQWLARWLRLDRAHREARAMAYHDELTGAWNRRFFNEFLREIVVTATERRRPVSVLVFDIDDFKRYNDDFGHEAGDVILRETVVLLKSVIRTCDRVCRIGGDEFAVIFADLDAPRSSGSAHPESVELIARRFQDQICRMRFPKLGLQAPGTLSISAGLATFPWDGREPSTLLRLADQRALESKRRGKNFITFGPGAAYLGNAEGPE